MVGLKKIVVATNLWLNVLNLEKECITITGIWKGHSDGGSGDGLKAWGWKRKNGLFWVPTGWRYKLLKKIPSFWFWYLSR